MKRTHLKTKVITFRKVYFHFSAYFESTVSSSISCLKIKSINLFKCYILDLGNIGNSSLGF